MAVCTFKLVLQSADIPEEETEEEEEEERQEEDEEERASCPLHAN